MATGLSARLSATPSGVHSLIIGAQTPSRRRWMMMMYVIAEARRQPAAAQEEEQQHRRAREAEPAERLVAAQGALADALAQGEQRRHHALVSEQPARQADLPPRRARQLADRQDAAAQPPPPPGASTLPTTKSNSFCCSRSATATSRRWRRSTDAPTVCAATSTSWTLWTRAATTPIRPPSASCSPQVRALFVALALQSALAADLLMVVCAPDVPQSVDAMFELFNEIMEIRGEQSPARAPIVLGACVVTRSAQALT